MIALRTLALAAVLAWMPGAFAQTAAAQGIERQMSPEQFKAAGLDKLSPAELANLNAWLNRTIIVETTRAAADAKKKVVDDNRGFFDFGSAEPIKSRITGEFRGFARGRNYNLDNGQVWEQVDDSMLSGVRLTNPQVAIKPSRIGNVWYMTVGRYNTQAKVKRVK